MTIEQLRAAAAIERSGQVRARADRPSQRRSSSDPGSSCRVGTRAAITLSDRKASGATSTVEFNGQASVYERGYEMYDMFGPYTEVVTAGACVDLSMPNLDVPLVLEHESLRRIARTTNGSLLLTQDDSALNVHAPELDMGDVDVAYIVPKMRSGLIDEMSFRFLITDGIWSPDYTEYRINGFAINRGDVAIVGYGASPHTSGAIRTSKSMTEVRAMLSRALDAPDVNMMTQALGWLTSIDMIVDEAQEQLAAYLGVASPDSCDCCGDGCTCGDCVACAPTDMVQMAATVALSSRLAPLPGDLDARTLRV